MKFKIKNKFSLFIITMIVFATSSLITISCNAKKNPVPPSVPLSEKGSFYVTRDKVKLFVYNYLPDEKFNCTIYLITGITGINHKAEKDVIELLSNNNNKVVVIHPRGTGYSEGKRGDISNFSDFIDDYVEIIKNDPNYLSGQHKTILFGHSMSTAILLAIAYKLEKISGAILVNPPYILKKAKGMSPDFKDYIKYAVYMIFARHKPIVNMSGDPKLIENAEDRKESEQRLNDPLLVKYFSMYMMMKSKKIMDSMIIYSKTAAYPLLIIYGSKDNIVDKKSCDLILNNWKHEDKKFVEIENGTHGKSTVLFAKNEIIKWIEEIKKSIRK